MEAKSRRTVGTVIGGIRIFLTGLHTVNLIVVVVELVVVQLVVDHLAEQNEHCKSDDKIREVDQRKNLVVPNISEDANEKMFDHGDETVTVSAFCFLVNPLKGTLELCI
jgi:hypothetical protein